MARICVVNWMTLDRVMQGPGRADEDTRDGFDLGGWSQPYSSEAVVRKFGETMSGEHALLLGRRSYQDLLAAWHRQGGRFRESLDATRKYVVSRDPDLRLEWPHSELLTGTGGTGGTDGTEAMAAVAELKGRLDTDLVVLGSGVLIGALLAAGLVDELVLAIAPVVLGRGRRLFPDGVRASLRLVEAVSTESGVVLATYAAA